MFSASNRECTRMSACRAFSPGSSYFTSYWMEIPAVLTSSRQSNLTTALCPLEHPSLLLQRSAAWSLKGSLGLWNSAHRSRAQSSIIRTPMWRHSISVHILLDVLLTTEGFAVIKAPAFIFRYAWCRTIRRIYASECDEGFPNLVHSLSFQRNFGLICSATY